jgi:hypothetical protein
MAAFHLVSMAAGGPPPPPFPWIQIGDLKVRLKAENPQIRSMMAFSATFTETEDSRHSLPNDAALERFFAFLGFLRAERQSGRIASWPEGLLRNDEKGNLALSNDLIMAAALADLKWGRPFDRNHLLALARQDAFSNQAFP